MTDMLDSYFAAWNAPDEEERRRRLEESITAAWKRPVGSRSSTSLLPDGSYETAALSPRSHDGHHSSLSLGRSDIQTVQRTRNDAYWPAW